MASEKILVVDDDEEIRILCKTVLTREGYQVTTVPSGSQALSIMENERFEIVMTDLKMPVMDGLDLLKAVKKKHVGTDVIMLTAYGSIESAVESMQTGAYDYITKPFDIQEMVLLVKKCIQNRRLSEEVGKLRETATLYQISKSLNEIKNIDSLLNHLLEIFCQFLNTKNGLIMLYDKETETLTVRSIMGDVKGLSQDKRIPFKFDQNFYSDIGPIIDINKLKNVMGAKNLIGYDAIKTGINIPLIVKGDLIGWVNLERDEDSQEITEKRKDFISIFVAEAGWVLSNNIYFDEIEKSKNYMESMVQGMSEGVLMFNNSGQLVLINPRARIILGLDSEKLIDNERLKTSPQFNVYELYEEAQKGDGSLVKDINLEIPRSIVIRVEIEPIKDIEGKRLGTVVIIRDITRHKEMEQMGREFIANVSHEFRSPLNTIIAYIERIGGGKLGAITPKMGNAAQIIQKNLNRLNRFINDLLDLSKLDSGKVLMKFEPVDIKKVVNDAIEILRKFAEEKNIKINIKKARKVPPIYADSVRITQVLVNLIHNAIKFSPSGASVDIGWEEKGDEVHTVVEDKGSGIALEDRETVFDRFRQLEQSTSGKSEGTGLGLAISKEILLQHSGRIWVESEVGKGSRFMFALPIYSIKRRFVHEIEKKIAICKREKVSCMLLLIDVKGREKIYKDMSKQEREEFERVIEDMLRNKIRYNTRYPDTLVRYNEKGVFALLGISSREGALKIRERIESAVVDLSFKTQGRKINVELLFGMAFFPDDATTSDFVMEKAEKELDVPGTD